MLYDDKGNIIAKRIYKVEFHSDWRGAFITINAPKGRLRRADVQQRYQTLFGYGEMRCRLIFGNCVRLRFLQAFFAGLSVVVSFCGCGSFDRLVGVSAVRESKRRENKGERHTGSNDHHGDIC